MLNNKNNYDLIKFEDGEFSLDVNVSPNEDTVWLTQEQISILYQKAKSTINEHIKKILEVELDVQDVSRKFGKTELSSVKTKPITYYNLDLILAVGYRVNSKRGILFRKWATSILKQY
ncbi:MAG: virulence RhuM family protein, partial [Anaeroplasmataceae bacterium]|nr:virulence RhuM family protein [Anaeroplasmataceae bacterium]